jgi:hypothetical protein
MMPFAAHGGSWAATVFVLASGRGHRVFENAEVGDLFAATPDLSGAFPTAGWSPEYISIARRQFCGRRRSVYAGGQMHPWVNALRVDCSDLRPTCSTEIPPEPARSRQSSNNPYVLVLTH